MSKSILISVAALLLSGCSVLDSELPQPQLSPVSAEVLRKDGNTLIKNGKYEEAVKIFDRLIADDPENALAYNGKAVAFDYSGNHLAAQEIYKTALSLSPDSLPIKNNLAMSLILNHQTKQAIGLLEPLVLGKNDKSVHGNIMRHNLALAYGISGQSDKALNLELHDMSEKQARENLRFYENYVTRITKKDKKMEKGREENSIGFITLSSLPSPVKKSSAQPSSEAVPATSPEEMKGSKDKAEKTVDSVRESTLLGSKLVYEYP